MFNASTLSWIKCNSLRRRSISEKELGVCFSHCLTCGARRGRISWQSLRRGSSFIPAGSRGSSLDGAPSPFSFRGRFLVRGSRRPLIIGHPSRHVNKGKRRSTLRRRVGPTDWPSNSRTVHYFSSRRRTLAEARKEALIAGSIRLLAGNTTRNCWLPGRSRFQSVAFIDRSFRSTQTEAPIRSSFLFLYPPSGAAVGSIWSSSCIFNR